MVRDNQLVKHHKRQADRMEKEIKQNLNKLIKVNAKIEEFYKDHEEIAETKDLKTQTRLKNKRLRVIGDLRQTTGQLKTFTETIIKYSLKFYNKK